MPKTRHQITVEIAEVAIKTSAKGEDYATVTGKRLLPNGKVHKLNGIVFGHALKSVKRYLNPGKVRKFTAEFDGGRTIIRGRATAEALGKAPAAAAAA